MDQKSCLVWFIYYKTQIATLVNTGNELPELRLPNEQEKMPGRGASLSPWAEQPNVAITFLQVEHERGISTILARYRPLLGLGMMLPM